MEEDRASSALPMKSLSAENWNKSAKIKTIDTIIGGCPAVFTDEFYNLLPAQADVNMRQDANHCDNDKSLNCIQQIHDPYSEVVGGLKLFD
jgi:hypothetical protein